MSQTEKNSDGYLELIIGPMFSGKTTRLIELYSEKAAKFGKENLFSIKFDIDDAFLFGNETSGLPSEILNSFTAKNKLRIPMKKQNRSLNLSNAASIVLYEAWRQNNFKSAEISFNG